MYFNNDNNLNEITVISYICYNDDGIINSNDNDIYVYHSSQSFIRLIGTTIIAKQRKLTKRTNIKGKKAKQQRSLYRIVMVQRYKQVRVSNV